MDAFEEISQLAPTIRPRAMASRLAYWRKAGIAGAALGDRVSGSRGHKLPAFDRTDAQINEAEKDYQAAIDGFLESFGVGDHAAALRQLRKAALLERLWLVPIKAADAEMQKELDGLASDAQSCNTCGDTKEAYVKRLKKRGIKTPLWKTRGGDCSKCWQEKRRARLAALAIIDPDPEAVAS